MNIEIVNELKKYVSERKNEISEIKAEYEELTSLTHTQNSADKRRIKEIRQIVAPLAERISMIEEDLTSYEDLSKEVSELNKCVSNLKNETSKKYLTEVRDSKVAEFDAFEDDLKCKYADILKDVIAAEEPEMEDSEDEETSDLNEGKNIKRNHYIGGGITLVALIAAIAILVNANSKKNSKQDTTTNDNPTKVMETMKPEDIPTLNPTATPELTLVTKELEQGFRDITDKEAVYERAQEIASEITKNNPDYMISESEIENMILWINGGVVENATKEDRDKVLNLYLDLLGRDVSESKEQFDFTKLFLEETKAKKAAQESFAVRKDILANLGTDKVNESADKLAELFAKSMNGLNGAQSFNTIETNMSKAIILLTNVYNYATADFDRAAIYTDENGFTYDLNEMMMSINTECIYDDPINDATEERKTVDLLTSLLDGALLDEINLKEAKGLSLTK